MRALMRVGWEIAVRTTALLGSFLVASAVLARVGSASLGAHQIAFQLFIFLALLLDALAIAAQVLVGRMLGAGDAAGARAAALRMILWSVALGAAFGVVLLALGDAIPHLFTGDDAVVARAHEIWWLFAALMPLNGAVFALDGILIGAGDTRFLMWGMLVSVARVHPDRAARARPGLGDRGRLERARGADRGAARDLRRALRVRALGGHRRAARVRATLSAAMRRLALIVCCPRPRARRAGGLCADGAGQGRAGAARSARCRRPRRRRPPPRRPRRRSRRSSRPTARCST